MIRAQRTIKKSISCEGIGLHTGTFVRMTLRPAPVHTGVVFVRTDLGNTAIEAIAANIGETSYATTLGKNGVFVKTVEHLLAAFAGLSIDNCFVELDAEETPIMDGSARPFVKLIADAGIRTQELAQPVLKVIKPVFVRDGGKQLAIWPAETTSISFLIAFDHPLLREQTLHYRPSEEAFLREVSNARTFGFMSDVRKLQAAGLARGASLDNAVALGEDSVLNKDGLRYGDEFVRHKVLDLVGDLSLLGMPVIGHVVAHKSGHALNTRLVSKLLNSPQSWILIGASENAQAGQREPRLQHALL